MRYGIMFFANDNDPTAANSYELLKAGSQFADNHGFAAVWTPERHFHSFGGLFPNPSVLSAALVSITNRVQIRAGSLILPLHNPIRVAEDWSLLDNLSGGRVGVSFGSGWNVNDFALEPERYATRREMLYEQIEVVRRLWSGECVVARNGQGNEINLHLSPKPSQKFLPIWITSSGSIDTFARAGSIGANILTHLVGQDLAGLAAKIRVYRDSRLQAGYSATDGVVSLMLHTYLGSNLGDVKHQVHIPFCKYLESSINLELKASRGGGGLSCGYKMKDPDISRTKLKELVDRTFERYFATSSLMGTVASCKVFVKQLEEVGVDEIACLIDFGLDNKTILRGLEYLEVLRSESESPEPYELSTMIESFREDL